MSATDKQDLLTRAAVIRDETTAGANTASRIGTWCEDSVDTILSSDYSALSAPTTSTDSTQGFKLGDEIKFGETIFKCYSASAGAADWRIIYSGNAQNVAWSASMAVNVNLGTNVTLTGSTTAGTINFTNLKGGYRGRISLPGVNGQTISFTRDSSATNVQINGYPSNSIYASTGTVTDMVDYYFDGVNLFITHERATKVLPRTETGTSYQIQNTDLGRALIMSNASNITVTFAGDLVEGFFCEIYKGNSGNVTFSDLSLTSNGDTITVQDEAASVLKASGNIRVAGNLS